jgi:hypothetical protein
VSNANWKNNAIQFPRLLAEINANVGISSKDWDALCASMDLTSEEVGELFDRADAEWERIKQRTCPPRKTPRRG